MSCSSRPIGRPCAESLASKQHDHQTADTDDSRDARSTDRIQDDKAVSTRLGVVVKAKEENLVSERTDAAFGRFDKRQAEIPRGVLDTVEVTGEPAVWCEHHDAGGMRVLAALRVTYVPEADGTRE